MSWALLPYPTLTREMIQQVGYISDSPELSYFEAGVQPLEYEVLSTSSLNVSGRIKDPKCNWTPDCYELHYEKRCRFTAAYYLFGEGGLAAEDAVIGVAVFWSSKGSSVRGSFPIGELRRTDSAIEFKQSFELPKNMLKGSVLVQTVLYVKEAGSPSPSANNYARQKGTILGGLDQIELIVDGNGSLFPIVVVEKPRGPLWEVYYNDTADIFQERFDNDNVEIRLNKAHPNFELLNIDTELSKTPLLVEVLASAMMVIIQSVKESASSEWDLVLNGEEGEPGSIAQAVHYFINNLNWNVSSPADMSKSIKIFFEKEG